MKINPIRYDGRKLDDLTGLLVKNGVKVVADARLRPDRASMSVCAETETSYKALLSYYYLLKRCRLVIVKGK